MKKIKKALISVSNKNNLINNEYVSYGNHTYNHYVLSSLTEQEQYYEINHNMKLLKKLNINLSKVFAFPFGGMNDYNKLTLNIFLITSHIIFFWLLLNKLLYLIDVMGQST